MYKRKGIIMTAFRIGTWAMAAMMLVGMVGRAEAQFMWGGGGSVRFSSIRGPFGGRVTVAQGPFGGGAVGVRGPFGGGVTFVQPGVVPVIAPPIVPTVFAPPQVVQQTVLNPAPAPMPYTPAYLSRIPPGLPAMGFGGTNYFYTTVLPPGSRPATVGGVNYFVNNGVFYQPYFLGPQTVYVVVER
jgi:hypothetical protein